MADAPRLELPRGAALAVSGRRLQVVAAETGWDVRLEGAPILEHAGVDGAVPGEGWIGPGIAGRGLVAMGVRLTERWLVGLDLPAVVWEVVPDQGPASLAWTLPSGAGKVSDDGTVLTVARPLGGWAQVSVAGGRLRVEPAGPAPRVTCDGPGPIRVEVAAGEEEADRDRVLALLARGPERLAEAWRQLARSAPRLETPDPEVDRAFTWAWLRSGGRPVPAPASPGPPGHLADAATRFLADPATPDPGPAARVLAECLGGLWGITADLPGGGVHLAPLLPPGWATMALRRWRVGRTVLDVELRRRRDDLVVRLHRVFGPRLVVTLEPRGARFESAVVDEVELRGGRARFEAADRHVIVFRGRPG